MLEAARRGHGDRGAVVRTGRIPTTGDCGAVSASCFAEQSAPGAGPGSSERFNRDTWVSCATNVDGLDGPFAEPNRAIAVVGWPAATGDRLPVGIAMITVIVLAAAILAYVRRR